MDSWSPVCRFVPHACLTHTLLCTAHSETSGVVCRPRRGKHWHVIRILHIVSVTSPSSVCTCMDLGLFISRLVLQVSMPSFVSQLFQRSSLNVTDLALVFHWGVHSRMCVCLSLCVYVFICVCLHVCLSVCGYVCVRVCRFLEVSDLSEDGVKGSVSCPMRVLGTKFLSSGRAVHVLSHWAISVKTEPQFSHF